MSKKRNVVIPEIKQIGHVSVDSGSIIIGDPYYFADGINGLTGNLGNKVGILAQMHLTKNSYAEFSSSEMAGKDRPDNSSLILSETLYGDGIYPVIARIDRDTGRVKSLLIDFDPEYED